MVVTVSFADNHRRRSSYATPTGPAAWQWRTKARCAATPLLSLQRKVVNRREPGPGLCGLCGLNGASCSTVSRRSQAGSVFTQS